MNTDVFGDLLEVAPFHRDVLHLSEVDVTEEMRRFSLTDRTEMLRTCEAEAISHSGTR